MAIVIALLALVFTIFSFYWLNARRGRLRMADVRVFACSVTREKANLRIPVTLFNSGAVPLVVVDIRLRAQSSGLSGVAPSKTFRTSIRPAPDDVQDFPHPFTVPGRGVAHKFIEFKVDPDLMITMEPLSIDIEVVLLDDRGWRKISSRLIRTDIVGDPGAYIAYSNDPADWPAGQAERAKRALAVLRERRGITAVGGE